MAMLGERTIKIDCDVLQADGGTRTASVNGGFIALVLSLIDLKNKGILKKVPIRDYVAAVSVGIYEKTMLLDLNYEEDSRADMDMNVVMVGRGEFVEIQGTAEKATFSKKETESLIALAKTGIDQLIEIQKQALDGLKI